MTLGCISHLQHSSSTPNLSFLPHRLAGGISSQVTLSPFSVFSHALSIHKKQIFGVLPCLPLSSCLFFLSDVFRNTCEIPRINVCPSATSPSPLFHKAGSLCCFTCLNICFVKIYHFTDVYIIYIFVWTSDPFLKLLARPVFSPFLSTAFQAYCGHTPCLLIQRGGEELF